jgi:hypothetical protein
MDGSPFAGSCARASSAPGIVGNPTPSLVLGWLPPVKVMVPRFGFRVAGRQGLAGRALIAFLSHGGSAGRLVFIMGDSTRLAAVMSAR